MFLKGVNIKQKPAWRVIRRKNGMKLLKKKTWDENLLALLGRTVNLEGCGKRASAREQTRLEKFLINYSSDNHKPAGVGPGTSISELWCLLLLFSYKLIENLLVDFHRQKYPTRKPNPSWRAQSSAHLFPPSSGGSLMVINRRRQPKRGEENKCVRHAWRGNGSWCISAIYHRV